MRMEYRISKGDRMTKKLDPLVKLIMKEAKKRGDNYRLWPDGSFSSWKKGYDATFVPLPGQPPLMILKKARKGKKKKKSIRA